MLRELECSRCRCRMSLDESLTTALEQVAAEGPWYALGDGETWEDRIHACLTSSQCGDCGAPIKVSEQGLAELSRELLEHW